MKNEKIIKSAKRVSDHGEVFTPQRIVEKMLNQAEMQRSICSFTSKVLEPAAGEGAFLLEILTRRLQLAVQKSVSIEDYEQMALIALTTLYGIELLSDNTQLLIKNMYEKFYHTYRVMTNTYQAVENVKVVKSAMTIIRANMLQGDALTGKNHMGNDILFSDWKLLPCSRGKRKVQRVEHSFDDIKRGKGNEQHGVEELTLFGAYPVHYEYLVSSLYDIYKETQRKVHS